MYLNGYAKHLGVHATAVYLSLCRHADKDQNAFPSQKLIAEETGMGERTCWDKIQVLSKWNIIRIEKMRSEGGKWLNNTYILLDKSEWKKHPSASVANGDPSASDDTNHPHVVRIKETHIKETHIDDEEIKIPSKKTNPLRLTRGQVISYLKAFPGLTTSELNEQSDLCNNYMGMSSWEIKNPGLFFRKWLTRYMTENKAKQVQSQKQAEQDKVLPDLTPEQREMNFKKIDEIRKGVLARI